MPVHFVVLASGSSGNATMLRVGGLGVLIDAGLGPRVLAQRLSAVGASWRDIDLVLLTHTHGDHWKEKTLDQILRRDLPIYCHSYHQEYLACSSITFAKIKSKGLVRAYQADQEIPLNSRFCFRPLSLRHDDRATFGFRFDVSGGPDHAPRAVGYLADLGCWDSDLALALREIDLLALEFNHDVEMEEASGRSTQLIERVLGDDGHLSNTQAAEFLSCVLRHSTPGRLRHLVQLHLSRQCNRQSLAVQAAREVRKKHDARFEIHTALQNQACPSLTLPRVPHEGSAYLTPGANLGSSMMQVAPAAQRLLPGCE
jgi:phosphoribosyl 1,2-cyclic phosphodiesterase